MKLISKRLYKEVTKVVDLQVQDIHNFAVGQNKIIVHNSHLRPRGAFIHGIGVESPGAVKYMELFDKSSEIITAGSGKKSDVKKAKGKIRKGAMMGILDITHPDIIEFIMAKQQPGRLTKFNTSVNVSAEFMTRLNKINELKQQTPTPEQQAEIAQLDKWDLVFPETSHPMYASDWSGNLADWQLKGYPVHVYNTISVTGLWNMIMESTYNRAEPGVLFLDRANELNPLNYGETIFATNPCAEQVLAAGGVCCLGTLNLTQFVILDPEQSGKYILDFNGIAQHVCKLVRFLDNVNNYSTAPLPEYEASMRQKRRIGCGVMGWGSVLFMLKLKFGSSEAAALQAKLMELYTRTAYESSIDLAIERGMFELCVPELHAKGEFIKRLNLSEEYTQKLLKFGIRNSALISQQPNGSSSILANVVSGGIEPIFMSEYTRTVVMPNLPQEMAAFTPKWFESEWFETEVFKFAFEGDEPILKGTWQGITYKIDKNRGLVKEVLCEDYGVRWLKDRDEWDATAPWAVTTNHLTVEDHVNDLNGFAKFTDSACSKCVASDETMVIINDKIMYLDELPSNKIEDSFLLYPFEATILNHHRDEVKIKSTYDNGNKPVLRIYFDDQSTLTGTFTHRVYTSDGWVKLQDLKIGCII